MTDHWEHGTTVANGLRFHFVEAGEGPTVLLLHGFPEFWSAWHRQLPSLADAGFHAIAPDLRGYNRSEKPPGVSNYRLDRLVEDVVALAKTVGEPPIHLVGHDWGGLLAWEVAGRRPEVVDRLAVLNAPHPRAYERELRSLDQLLRSWYVAYFQVPFVPETVLGAGDAWLVGRLLESDPVRDDAFSWEDVRRYRAAASRPGALRAAVHYYRALGRATVRDWIGVGRGRPPGAMQASDIDVPTLLLWGLQDDALSPRLTTGLDRWINDLAIERFPDASHWLQADAPDRVSTELVAFLEN